MTGAQTGESSCGKPLFPQTDRWRRAAHALADLRVRMPVCEEQDDAGSPRVRGSASLRPHHGFQASSLVVRDRQLGGKWHAPFYHYRIN